MRFTGADGKKSDVDFKGGEIVWREAETHAGENIGPGECHAMQVEMKQPPPAARKDVTGRALRPPASVEKPLPR